ncbi:hypothetical protein BAMY6639_07510 [Bacillus amyloliquefaciens UMAF6639]|nr:hypothetical protein BAMY6639_07510 [Bacillus amyloliquefaciens UMAF6639]RAP18824.1 hypothetical protein C2W63_03003 [Bacillus velezensis]RUR97117.1 hypothetical protein EFW57_03357 [Bacillus velezensis]
MITPLLCYLISKTLQRSYQNLIKKSKKSILHAEECFFS